MEILPLDEWKQQFQHWAEIRQDGAINPDKAPLYRRAADELLRLAEVMPRFK